MPHEPRNKRRVEEFNLQEESLLEPGALEQDGLFGDISPVSEPGSLTLPAMGLAGLMWLRRRRGDAPNNRALT